jgi:hypothetical protein
MSDKKVLIVFPDIHLPYSPSTLNLFYALKKRGVAVTLLAPEPEEHFSLQRVNDENIKYIDCRSFYPGLIKRVAGKVVNKLVSKDNLRKRELKTPKASAFINAIMMEDADTIIAVDFFSLWCVQQTGRRASLLSLEILESDAYYCSCDFKLIDSVFIQSEVRYNYLFKEGIKPSFAILPNSPAYIDLDLKIRDRDPYNLIYCGSAVIDFGIFSCLDFLIDYPGYKLTLKGAVPAATREGIEKFYSGLIEEGRLIINEEYMDSITLTSYVANFRIGFVFYDFYRVPKLRRFNYYTAPSGKLFQYFNSGVPVIGNCLEAFDIVEEFHSGKLVSSLGSLQLKKAIDVVEADYQRYAENAKKLSLDFDQDKFLNVIIDQYLNL